MRYVNETSSCVLVIGKYNETVFDDVCYIPHISVHLILLCLNMCNFMIIGHKLSGIRFYRSSRK